MLSSLLVAASALVLPRAPPHRAPAGVRCGAPSVLASAATTSASTPSTSTACTLGAWLPVGSVAALSGLGPTRVEICGADYAVWEHEGHWSVLADVCPHRLAPLSQVRDAQRNSSCTQ